MRSGYNRVVVNTVRESNALEQMIRKIMDYGVRDERVLTALRHVPREKFVERGHQSEAYADRALPIGHGQTISQPYIVALMTQRLDVQPDHRVLEIGTGSGYQAAVLSHLAKEVFTIERVKPLLDEAFHRVLDLGIRNVRFRYGDGTEGWPEEAPFDRILIAAGAPEMPRQLLLSHLKEGGLAMIPIGPRDTQTLLGVRKRDNDLLTAEIIPCRFVPLIGKAGWPDESTDEPS
jgi:protein-L-isoaspartate(D-aspartate) O-methyltransferase